MWFYGDLPSGWKTERIGNYAELITDYVANGSFASLAENVQYKSEPDYAVLIRLTDHNNGFNGDFVYIDKSAYEFLAKSKLFGGEIIISNVGANVGTVFKCPDLNTKMSLAPNAIMLKTKGDDDFYYYWFSSRNGQHSLKSIVTGSAQPKFNKTNFKDLLVPVPPIETQKKIACYLRTIDEKIALNTAINNNLEQQATTMFRRFYDSSNNTVPFTSMIRVLGGGTPKTGEPSFWNGTIPFFTPKDVGSPYSFNTEKTITEEGLNHCNSRLYPQNTVFVTARGTVGKVSMAGLPMAMNQSCYALVGINIDQILAYHYTLVTVNKLKHKATGAVFDAIITKDFETESISRLTDKDAEDFLAVAKPIYSAILTNSLENQRLISLRDTLLPRLMSGKLDLSDVDF